MYIQCGETEIEYLKSKDKRLAEVIDAVGMIQREVDDDLFCLQRPCVLGYGDLAIQRGMRMVNHHRKITPELFRKCQRGLSPYCSVASLYFWAVAGGAVPSMRDYAPKAPGKLSKKK
ncbi:MAG: hypothetical protein ACI37P_07910 [Eggerthellaceae bacterium]